MGGKCTCCNDWCYHWIPENEVSKLLREKYHRDDMLYGRLENLFGDDFLKRCAAPQKAHIVIEMLQIVVKFDEKLEAWNL